jgi:hypothetical protein
MQIDAIRSSPSQGLADKSSPVRLADKSSPVRLADEGGLAETNSSVRLADLPVELLLHIFQYLEVKFITEVLARVCSLFRYQQYLVASHQFKYISKTEISTNISSLSS